MSPVASMSENGATDDLLKNGFLAIGEAIYFSRGSEEVDSTVKDPTIILIFGWMSARLPHLYKYTETYAKLYPNATQLLVTCSPSAFWKSQRSREAILTPVVETLEALGCISPQSKAANASKPESNRPAHRILVHAFSNGGAYQLTTLSTMLSRRQASASDPRLKCAIILDSCPGGTALSLALRAFLAPFRNRLLRAVVSLFVLALYAYGSVLSFLFRRKEWMPVLKETLQNPRVLPWTDARTPRLYVFSKSDEMVPVQQVQAHADQAIARGLNVRMEIYEISPHVAHARSDPSRYWGAVSELWNAACQIDE